MKDFEYHYNNQMIIFETQFRENSYERVERERKAQGEGTNDLIALFLV